MAELGVCSAREGTKNEERSGVRCSDRVCAAPERAVARIETRDAPLRHYASEWAPTDRNETLFWLACRVGVLIRRHFHS